MRNQQKTHRDRHKRRVKIIGNTLYRRRLRVIKQIEHNKNIDIGLIEEYIEKVNTTASEQVKKVDFSGKLQREDSLCRKSTDWSSDKNARRVELIRRKVDGNISLAEMFELEMLTNELRVYRHLYAPLPIEQEEELNRVLTQKLNQLSDNAP